MLPLQSEAMGVAKQKNKIKTCRFLHTPLCIIAIIYGIVCGSDADGVCRVIFFQVFHMFLGYKMPLKE
jgi:hypothetical protein